jgi:hypothetical protein
MRSLKAGSLLAYFDDSGLDDVLEFLLGLIPHYKALATWISWHIRVAELNCFDFAGLPMLESHEFFGHAFKCLSNGICAQRSSLRSAHHCDMSERENLSRDISALEN